MCKKVLATSFFGTLLAFIFISAGCGGSSSSTGNPGTNSPNGASPYPGIAPTGEIRGEGNFATLINKYPQGQAKHMPWAGYWWPYSSNGISDAASLYDHARGTTTAANWEVAHHGTHVPNLQSWFGHCNGWAAAAVLYNEPRVVTQADGVSFGVADQKSILSELAMEVNADFYGTRNEDDNPNSASFQDVAPDVFFLVLSNYTGNGLGTVIDRYTGSQVWNQPVAGYQTAPVKPADYLGASPSAPGIYRVMVTTQLWWASDNVEGGHLTEPFAFKDTDSFESRTLRYEVWMDAPLTFDASGNIQSSGKVVVARQGGTAIGGAWSSDNSLNILNSHPDYIWVPHAPSISTGFSNPYIDVSWVESHFGQRNAN